VLLKDTAHRKGYFHRKDSDTKLLQSVYFASEVGIFSSYSDRICYRKIAKSRTKDAWELHATLRTVFENHCSTSNTTNPASYDANALAMTKETSKACRTIIEVCWCPNSKQSRTRKLILQALVSRNWKGPGVNSQMSITPAPVQNFQLNSGSGSWFLIWAPAPGEMPSSGTPTPLAWIICTRILNVILAS